MATSGKDTGIVGYNVQTAVDTKNHLIVAHEVTNVGTDRHQLSNMAEQARTEMGVETLDAVADRGYYASDVILRLRGSRYHCHATKTYNPRTQRRLVVSASKILSMSRLTMSISVQPRERLTYRAYNERCRQDPPRCYWTNACRACALKSKCTPETVRRVSRWEHYARLEIGAGTSLSSSGKDDDTPSDSGASVRHDQVLDGSNALSHEDGCRKAATEMALNALAYNIKRVMAIIGVAGLLEALAT